MDVDINHWNNETYILYNTGKRWIMERDNMLSFHGKYEKTASVAKGKS